MINCLSVFFFSSDEEAASVIPRHEEVVSSVGVPPSDIDSATE